MTNFDSGIRIFKDFRNFFLRHMVLRDNFLDNTVTDKNALDVLRTHRRPFIGLLVLPSNSH